jgi:hypothetical protein
MAKGGWPFRATVATRIRLPVNGTLRRMKVSKNARRSDLGRWHVTCSLDNMQSNWRSVPALLLIAACGSTADSDHGTSGSGGGGSTTSTSTVGSATGSGSGGGAPYPLGSLEEPCYGITGKDVIGAALPEYTTMLAYTGAEPNAGSTTPLTMRIRYEGGTITCNPPVTSGPSGADTGPHLTVNVALDFDTGDGAFQETVAAQLDAFTTDKAQLSATETAGAVVGTYDPSMPTLTDVTITFDGSVASAVTSGTVLKHGQKSADVGETAFVATW